jgi:hypothetical protein
MFAIIYLLGTFIADLLKSRRQLEVENLWLSKTPSEKGLVRRDEIFPAVACQGSRRVRGVELNGIKWPLGGSRLKR